MGISEEGGGRSSQSLPWPPLRPRALSTARVPRIEEAPPASSVGPGAAASTSPRTPPGSEEGSFPEPPTPCSVPPHRSSHGVCVGSYAPFSMGPLESQVTATVDWALAAPPGTVLAE